MANKKQITQRKQELVLQLAKSRESISQTQQEVQQSIKEKLQFKAQAKRMVSNAFSRFTKRKPKSTKMIAGSALLGLAAALFVRRPKRSSKNQSVQPVIYQSQVPKSTRVVILGWLLTLIKPAAKSWILTHVKELATQTAKKRPITTKNIKG